MQTIELNIFTFNELRDKAKEHARDWWRRASEGDSFFSEWVIDDAKQVAQCFGLDIDKIYFSGFWSQGDGACFEGCYKYAPNWKKALTQYAPQDAELLRIGQALQDAQKRFFYKLEANTKHRGHYYHSGCMSFDIEHREDRGRDVSDIEDDIKDALRAFADWVYRRLEDAYEHENSDDVIGETLEANGYTFTEDGERFDA